MTESDDKPSSYTPRTDAAVEKPTFEAYGRLASFARQLERELVAYSAEIQAARRDHTRAEQAAVSATELPVERPEVAILRELCEAYTAYENIRHVSVGDKVIAAKDRFFDALAEAQHVVQSAKEKPKDPGNPAPLSDLTLGAPYDR